MGNLSSSDSSIINISNSEYPFGKLSPEFSTPLLDLTPKMTHQSAQDFKKKFQVFQGLHHPLLIKFKTVINEPKLCSQQAQVRTFYQYIYNSFSSQPIPTCILKQDLTIVGNYFCERGVQPIWDQKSVGIANGRLKYFIRLNDIILTDKKEITYFSQKLFYKLSAGNKVNPQRKSNVYYYSVPSQKKAFNQLLTPHYTQVSSPSKPQPLHIQQSQKTAKFYEPPSIVQNKPHIQPLNFNFVDSAYKTLATPVPQREPVENIFKQLRPPSPIPPEKIKINAGLTGSRAQSPVYPISASTILNNLHMSSASNKISVRNVPITNSIAIIKQPIKPSLSKNYNLFDRINAPNQVRGISSLPLLKTKSLQPRKTVRFQQQTIQKPWPSPIQTIFSTNCIKTKQPSLKAVNLKLIPTQKTNLNLSPRITPSQPLHQNKLKLITLNLKPVPLQNRNWNVNPIVHYDRSRQVQLQMQPVRQVNNKYQQIVQLTPDNAVTPIELLVTNSNKQQSQLNSFKKKQLFPEDQASHKMHEEHRQASSIAQELSSFENNQIADKANNAVTIVQYNKTAESKSPRQGSSSQQSSKQSINERLQRAIRLSKSVLGKFK